ncbi:MAG: hypothetical protein ACREBN_04820 [Burkholderiaceae bacterium]
MDSKTIATWALHYAPGVTRHDEHRDLDSARGILSASIVGLTAWYALFALWSWIST